MSSAYLAPDPIQGTQFIPGTNTPAAGAKLFCYINLTTTKQNTYTGPTAVTAWSNPIVLDSGGNLNGEVWIPAGLPATFVLAPPNSPDPPNSPYWTRDNITGVNDASATQGEWVAGNTPTYVNATTFTLAGDQTPTYQVRRRLKTTNTGGTVYSTILTSVFTTLTTITVVNDSGVLDSGLSAVSYGLLSQTNLSFDGNFLNIKTFGAKGDGTTNDTTAWLAFKAACLSEKRKGFLPVGTYLIDAFTFDTNSSGLVLEGESYGRTGAQQPESIGGGAGIFGVPPTKLLLRTASSKFVTIDGVLDLDIKNVSLDGNKFADNVLYFTGVNNNASGKWADSFFWGATPTTGYTHRYDGSNGGEAWTFSRCVLRSCQLQAAATPVAAHVYNTNTNAFLGKYENCIIHTAADLVKYNQGSCNLYDCQFFGGVNAQITMVDIVQPFIITNPYTEQGPNVPFFRQVGTAGVNSPRAITIINPMNNSTNAPFNLNCQQPVIIIGGDASANIDVTPYVVGPTTYGIHTNIVDSFNFLNTGYGFIGTGVATNLIHRGCTDINGPGNTFRLLPNQSLAIAPTDVFSSGAVGCGARTDLTNAGATPALPNKKFIGIVNAAPQNITDFTGGTNGQEITLEFQDANTTLVAYAGGQFLLAGSVNVNPTAGSIINFILQSTVWRETGRSIR